MSAPFPNQYLLSQPDPRNIVAYAYGPTGSSGVPLPSGTYFSGIWAAWWNPAMNVVRVASIPSFSTPISIYSTGTPLNILPIQTPDGQRITNLSLAFGNSGETYLCVQDNGDSFAGFSSFPQVRVAGSGGAFQTAWAGQNPVLVNTVNVNWPYAVPQAIYPSFQTGLLACYYTSADCTTLYSRYVSEGFQVEHTMNTALPSGFALFRTQFNPQINAAPYNQFQKTLFGVQTNGNVIVYESKPSISFAFETFDLNPTGAITGLTSGYGCWIRTNCYAPSQGYVANQNAYLQETFDEYVTGAITGLGGAISFMYGVTYSGYTTGIISSY